MKQLLIGLTLTLALVGCSPACRTVPPTVETPQGVVAYQLEDAVDAVNAIQHEAIVLNHAGKMSRETALKIVRYRRAAAAVMDKAIDAGTGCAAAVADASNGLDKLIAGLNAADKSALVGVLGSAQTILKAVGGLKCQ